MKRNLLLLSVLLFVAEFSNGQAYTFKVLANRGDNKVKTGQEWKPIKTGASLNSQDELSVSSNAYLGLVHASGRTMELRDAGNHKVADLAKKVSQGGSSVASKYADFVLSKMSAEGKKNRLSATGAVHRGLGDPINIYLPNAIAEVYGAKTILRWDSAENAQVYQVTLKNMFEDTLLEIETNQSSVELDMSDEKLAKENVLLIEVVNKNDPTAKPKAKAIRKLNADKTAEVKTQLAGLMEGVEEETALNKYILAGFFEENDLLADALTSYEEAIQLAPGVSTFKEAYEEFLYRNGMKSINN
ncbi:MAG: hypothetical protein MJA30_02895 [Cytophagales bacterium]|nr:hypothetical protein [Cytophagales bacterium]